MVCGRGERWHPEAGVQPGTSLTVQTGNIAYSFSPYGCLEVICLCGVQTPSNLVGPAEASFAVLKDAEQEVRESNLPHIVGYLFETNGETNECVTDVDG